MEWPVLTDSNRHMMDKRLTIPPRASAKTKNPLVAGRFRNLPRSRPGDKAPERMGELVVHPHGIPKIETVRKNVKTKNRGRGIWEMKVFGAPPWTHAYVSAHDWEERGRSNGPSHHIPKGLRCPPALTYLEKWLYKSGLKLNYQ